MRGRVTHMILIAVTIVALVMGVPGVVLGSVLAWNTERDALNSRTQSLVRVVDRRVTTKTPVSAAIIREWAEPLRSGDVAAHAHVVVPGQPAIDVGRPIVGPAISASAVSATGTQARLEISATPAIRRVGAVIGFFLLAFLISELLGWAVANRMSRRLSAPLIYLAAQAEQIGSGEVRARVKPSGIEEIDLVQDELKRTGERMAGRLAAEREFAADASHQLRTPLTALSMRLEEIQMLSTQEDVRKEAGECLDQVDRATKVIADLIDSARRESGTTEAIHVVEVFNMQREEWEKQYEAARRPLVFRDEAAVPVLGDTGKLSQVLATLIENSLRYGAGQTLVRARKAASGRGVAITVSDEGEGVADELAPRIFESGVSGHGSSGIGLALAKNLTQGMGGHLELTQRRPPIFTVSLSAIPASLDPDRVMPQGPLVSVGRRSRRY